MMTGQWDILNREQVAAAVHFRHPPRPPRANILWYNPATLAAHGDAFRKLLADYPDDPIMSGMGINYWEAPADDPNYRFAFGAKVKPPDLAVDACPVIADWSEFDQFLAEFPDADRRGIEAGIVQARRDNPDRYILASWGHYFHQRLAYLRGIEQLLFDFYDAPDKLRAIMGRLLEFYRVWARRTAAAGADGVWAGDDLGTQTSLFLSPDLFRELYAPYYRALAHILHAQRLDFWLHSCGNVTELMDDLIACGVDCLHPIQAGTMNDAEIARRYGGKLAFWIGMDVQKVIPFGTPAEIRTAVRKRIQTFYRPEGGLILAAGNAILPDTPLENIKAYLETLHDTM
jgi:hypothetical protein